MNGSETCVYCGVACGIDLLVDGYYYCFDTCLEAAREEEAGERDE